MNTDTYMEEIHKILKDFTKETHIQLDELKVELQKTNMLLSQIATEVKYQGKFKLE